MWASSSARAHAPRLCPYWMVQSLFFFFLLNDSLVLYRCSLSSAITLCPSLPPAVPPSLPLFCALHRSLLGQFNQGAMRPWASLLFHHAVTLSGEKYSFIGFLSLSVFFCLSHPLSLSCPIVLCLFLLSLPLPQSLPLSLFIYPLSLFLPPRSHHHSAVVSCFARTAPLSVPFPPFPLVICPRVSFPPQQLEQRHTAIKSPLITSQ